MYILSAGDYMVEIEVVREWRWCCCFTLDQLENDHAQVSLERYTYVGNMV